MSRDHVGKGYQTLRLRLASLLGVLAWLLPTVSQLFGAEAAYRRPETGDPTGEAIAGIVEGHRRYERTPMSHPLASFIHGIEGGNGGWDP